MRVIALLLLQMLSSIVTILVLCLAVYGDNLPVRLNDEVLGLIVFKSGLADPTSALSSWSADDATPCNWAHLQCSPSTSTVLRLSLDNLSLSGHLPHGLDRLPDLQSLSLSNNRLSGDLTPQLSLLPHLTSLSLSHNSLSGVLPDDLGRLTSLRSLDLSANSLSGTISNNLLSTSLRFLDLSANRLSGPIPTTLPQCTLLLHLNLSYNSLSGNFITGLTSLIRLRVLDISHNSISGPIPDTITNLRQLKILHLSNNEFSGAVPPNLGLCTHLTRLDLSRNLFNGPLPASIQFLTSLTFLSLSDNHLAGELPLWLGKLAALQHCDLSTNNLIGKIPDLFIGLVELTEIRLNHNGFNGSVPSTLFELGLQMVDLSSNNFTGEIPPGSTKLAETLEKLDLSDNRLTGVIPPEVALYFKLRYLNLSWNELWARVPPELGYFRDLSVLDLRRSGLNGAIPGELCDSGSIAVLQLDDNSLSGPIPEEIGNCSSLYLLSLSHNSLNSSIPTAMSRLKKLKILNLEYNKLTGEVPKQLGGLDSLLAVNISHNNLVGRLPNGGIFPSLDQSALQGNLGLCTPLVTEPCMLDVPKPLVLNPFAYGPGLQNTSNREPLVTEANPMSPQHSRFLSVSSIVAISAALVIVFGVLVVSLVNVSVRQRIEFIENTLDSVCSSSTKLGPSQSAGKVVLFGPRSSFQSEDLAGGAESLLSKASEIGRGTFGVMYRATIGNNRLVAIKKLLVSVAHSDFDRDVQILAKARHPNVMSLKGYYWTPHLQLLISDYAPKGSLHTLLHDGSAKPLTWSNRFRIVSGTARGLAHLHQSRPPIVHYNVKPSNILVDEYFSPMVSDFGLAKLVPNQMISSRFHGAVGYMAPEMTCQSLRVTEKCDVYGFGVVVLELVTGRRAVEYGEEDVVILIDQVRVLMEQGSAMDCVDPRMGLFPDEEVLPVLKLGMVCTSQIPSSRPSMTEVVQILQVIKTPVMD